jgi:hypothetical protein
VIFEGMVVPWFCGAANPRFICLKYRKMVTIYVTNESVFTIFGNVLNPALQEPLPKENQKMKHTTKILAAVATVAAAMFALGCSTNGNSSSDENGGSSSSGGGGGQYGYCLIVYDCYEINPSTTGFTVASCLLEDGTRYASEAACETASSNAREQDRELMDELEDLADRYALGACIRRGGCSRYDESTCKALSGSWYKDQTCADRGYGI